MREAVFVSILGAGADLRSIFQVPPLHVDRQSPLSSILGGGGANNQYGEDRQSGISLFHVNCQLPIIDPGGGPQELCSASRTIPACEAWGFATSLSIHVVQCLSVFHSFYEGAGCTLTPINVCRFAIDSCLGILLII